MLKILLLEDDKSLNRGISLKLQKEGYEVLSAFGVTEAEEVFRTNQIDLIISDITMNDGNGLDFAKEVRKKSDVHILFLTALDQEVDIVNGYDVGADDYITKPFNPLELLARVKSMMRRYTSLGSIAEKNNVIRIGDVELDKDAKEVRVNGKLVKMTATEYGILQLLMENAGKVFSIDEIYERVWNESSFSPENTVSVHIRRIREKIEINPKEPRYLKVVWGIGYKIEKI